MTGALALILTLAAAAITIVAIRMLWQGKEVARSETESVGNGVTSGYVTNDEDPIEQLERRLDESRRGRSETDGLVKKYKKLAAIGDVHAIYELAALYRIGQHVKQDERKAAELYTMGADLGDGDCMRGLASMYEMGQGVEKNPIMAYVLFDMALSHLRGPEAHATREIIKEDMKGLREEMSLMERAVADKHVEEQRQAEREADRNTG